MKYLEEQVRSGVADWVDPRDPRQGIVAREMLHFGEKALPVETVALHDSFRADGELRGVKFVPPKNESKPSMAAIRESWDWRTEANLLTA
jgi:hypothetical protein